MPAVLAVLVLVLVLCGQQSYCLLINGGQADLGWGGLATPAG